MKISERMQSSIQEEHMPTNQWRRFLKPLSFLALVLALDASHHMLLGFPPPTIRDAHHQLWSGRLLWRRVVFKHFYIWKLKELCLSF